MNNHGGNKMTREKYEQQVATDLDNIHRCFDETKLALGKVFVKVAQEDDRMYGHLLDFHPANYPFDNMLYRAADRQQNEAVGCLLELGAFWAKDDMESAIKDGKLHIVKCMLDNGYANVTADHVRQAIIHNQLEIFKLLYRLTDSIDLYWASWYCSTHDYTELESYAVNLQAPQENEERNEPNGEFNECGWETNSKGETLLNGETNAQFNARMGVKPLPERPLPTVEANRYGEIVLNGETAAEFNKRMQS